MYKKITAVAMVAVLAAMTASASVIFDTRPRDDQAGFTAGGTVATGAGQTFQADLSADLTQNKLSTIQVDNRSASATGTGLYLAVYTNNATAGTTWNPADLVGVSTNTQDMDVDGGSATWTFSNEALANGGRYLFTFTSDAAGTTTVAADTGVRLNTGGTEQSAFTSGGIAFSGSHTMASTITTVPEPATFGMLGAFGAAILFIRRKMTI